MRSLLNIILIFIIAVSTSCNQFEISKNANTFFHVEINNTELPVWVKGNSESNKLLIYINGGPGLTSLDVAHSDMFGWSEILEDEFAVVYYDQRGCGNSQGNLDEESLTVAQYVLDLDAIVTVLQSKYQSADLFLMSHSFGSFIGTNYLMDSVRQSKISGWININGALNFDNELQWKYRRDFLINLAKEELSEGNEIDYWTDAVSWTDANPIIDTDARKDKWRDIIGDPGQVIIPVEEGSLSFAKYMSIGFLSPYNPFPAYLSKNLKIVNEKLNEDLDGKNLISEVSNITLPTLVIWGRYDDLIPIEQGFDVFNNLGTSAGSKSFVIMEKSSHEPFISDPQNFQIHVADFVK